MRKSEKIKKNFSNRSLKVLAGTMTVIWILLLCFPIYWMVVSSLSGSSAEQSNEISFWISPPKCYTMIVEYTGDELKQLGDDGVYLQANSLLWRMYNYKMAETGKTQIVIISDGDFITSYSLSKADFEINKNRMWTKNILTHADIERVISVIKESNAVVEEKQKAKVSTKKNTNQYSEEMLADFSTDKDILGTLKECKCYNSYENIFDNYKIAWAYPEKIGLTGGLLQPIANTLFVTLCTTFLSITVTALAAYSLSKLLPRSLKNKMQLLIMASSMVPGTIMLIPKFQVIQNIGLSDSFWALILPACGNFGAMLLFKGTFDAYPNEVLEAARIDGAGELYVFSRLALPAARGVVGVQILTTFAHCWNEYFWPSMIIRDESRYTVALVINYMMNIGSSGGFNVMLALGFIISIPTLLVYAFFQKFLTYGIDFSGVKG